MPLDVILRVPGAVYERELAANHRLTMALKGLDALAPEALETAEVLITSGTVGLTAAEIARLPRLRMIGTIGTGYENVDLAAARARGIAVTHAAGANAAAVAEHAFGLLLSVVRAIPAHFDCVKAGQWRGSLTPRPMITGKTLGIFGLGDIGTRIGRIASAFEMEVHYASRTEKPQHGWTFHRDLLSLAKAVDCLVVVAPGGPQTLHAVNGEVLAALGPKGYLISLGRGSVVDTNALIAALNAGLIAGAGVDVYETEPHVPADLVSAPNVVLTPHIAGVSSDVQIVSARRILENIAAVAAGRPPLTPVPELADR